MNQRAQEFVTAVIREHSHIHADGRAVANKSQAELAELFGISAGTLNWYLRCLGDQVLARRPLTFAATCRAVVSLVGDDDDALLVRVEAQLAELSALVAAIRSRGTANSTRGTANATRGSASFPRVVINERPPASAFVAVPRVAAVAEPRLCELLAPLERLVVRCRLQPVTNQARLTQALAAYSDAEVRQAVERICDDVARGVPVRSPYGLLLSRALSGDTSFQIPPRVIGPPVDTPPGVDGDDPVDDLTVVAVAGLDVTELAELDREVDEHLCRIAPALSGRLATVVPLRHALRADLYGSRTTLKEQTP